MKLSELKKPAKSAAPVVPTESGVAAPEAPQEPQGTTTVTPSGIEIAYEWAPRRLYRLRSGTHDLDWFEVPSVTTVLGVLDKSGPLTWWGQGVGVEGTLELLKQRKILAYQGQYMVGGVMGSNGLLGASEATKDNVTALLTEHKLTVNHVKDKAADRGVNVHGALEQWVGTRKVTPVAAWPEHERGYVEGLFAFLAAIEDSVAGEVEAELMVGSLEHRYAGRFDLVLTLSKPVEVVTRVFPKKPPRIEEIPAGRYLLDLKTSKRVYDTHYLQLEAYEYASRECGYPATDYRGVVHVTEDGRYELALNMLERGQGWCFEDFLAVRKVYQVMNEREILRIFREDLDAQEVK